MNILTINEAAVRLRVTRKTIQNLRESGDFCTEIQISPRRIGFLETDFNAWIESRKKH